MKNSQGNTFRINLSKSRDFVGIRSTRCQRKYNQDRYKVLVLNPPTLSPELSAAAAAAACGKPNEKQGKGAGGKGTATTTEGAQMDADKKTLFYFAIFDGHGGSHTADYLTANLDEYVERAQPDMVPNVIKELRKLGGYFRSFRPHFLEPFLPSNFEEAYGSKQSAEDKARQQRRIHIKGKGGQVKPMIFIPHPNASEEEQQQEVESIQSSTLPKIDPASSSSKGASGMDKKEVPSKAKANEEEIEYDEDEDPFVIARRRRLNKTSPLPSGTTSYFGTDRSEYQNLFLKEMVDPSSETLAVPPDPPIPSTMTLEQRLFLSFLQCDTELIRDKYTDGSTASIVVVQSKGAFWETQEDLDLIVAHVGDTRILLCEALKGECVQLTTDHHPDAVVEAGMFESKRICLLVGGFQRIMPCLLFSY